MDIFGWMGTWWLDIFGPRFVEFFLIVIMMQFWDRDGQWRVL